ncbi:FAD-dependent oxidoreductase [Streptomyces sp. NPDC002577]
MASNATPRTRTALVIGGGIAGPVAAMALQKAGITASIHEAHQASADNVGGGLTIAPNGLSALDTIGAGDAVRPVGTPVTALVIQDWAGRRLAEFGNPPGVAPMQFVWRADLYRALYAEAVRRGIRIEHGKQLVGARETADGVTARFADGTRARADILIGADGIRSTVRTLIDPAAPGPAHTGLISFGARVQDTGLPSTGGKMNMSFGKRGFFGYQIFEDSSAVWWVNLPRREPLTAKEAGFTTAEEWKRRLTETFSADRTAAADLIARTAPSDLLVIGSMENMPKIPAWSLGRMVLVGDAAHAPSSTSGQGASLSAESAVELARCLRDLPHGEAFTAYEALRRPRVERIIAETARQNRNKTAGPVGRTLTSVLLRIVGRLSKPEKTAWMVDHHIDWAAPAPGTTRHDTART